MKNTTKFIIGGAAAIIALLVFLIVNPFSWNDAGNRTVVEQSGGNQFVQFTPGIFYAGFFAKEKEWPNQISVLYQDSIPNIELEDNGIEIGQISVRFNDATTAKVKGITQYILPSDATTKSAISKQELMTAQQQTLTAKAKGEQALVEIEYQQRQEQTKQVVEAETKVKVAEQDKLQQKIAYEGSILEAKKIKELANAEAYAKKAVMIADGALEKKIAAYVQVQEYWAKAFGEYGGAITPTYMMGGSYSPGSYNGAQNFMDLITAKTMRDLNLEMKNK